MAQSGHIETSVRLFAFGAKRTSRERRERADPARMTQSRHRQDLHPGVQPPPGASCAIVRAAQEEVASASPRFRTIQVCAKDLAALLRQVERAVDRLLAPRREEARCST